MAIVTIARETGALGKKSSLKLAEKMSGILVDKNALEQNFSDFGIDFSLLDKYDEKKPGILSVFSNAQELYFLLMKAALLQTVDMDKNAVVLGRGANLMLADLPNCLKVRLIAPLELRCARVQKATSCSQKEALQFIKNCDMHRSGFCRFHYDASWEDVNAYDLVINTEKFDEEQVTELILDAVSKCVTPEKEIAGKKLLDNLVLAQNVKKHILFDRKIDMPIFDIIVREPGVIELQGATSSGLIKNQVEEFARECMGVKDVINNVQVAIEKLHAIGH